MRKLQSTEIGFHLTLGNPSGASDAGDQEWALLRRLEDSGFFERSDRLVERLPPNSPGEIGEELQLVEAFELCPEFGERDGEVVFTIAFDFGDRFSLDRLEVLRAFVKAELARPDVSQGREVRLVGIAKTDHYLETVRAMLAP